MSYTTFKELASKGFGDELIAVTAGAKKPVYDDWPKKIPTDDELDQWDHAGYSIGLKTKYFPTFDIDCDDRTITLEIDKLLAEALGNGPCRLRMETTPQKGSASRRARIFALGVLDAPFRKMVVKAKHPKDGRELKVEVLAEGQQVVIAGIHPSGDEYFSELARGESSDLPNINADKAQNVLHKIKALLDTKGFDTQITQKGSDSQSQDDQDRAVTSQDEWDELPDILDNILDADEYDNWIRVGLALRACAGDSPERESQAFGLWDGWSQKSDKYDNVGVLGKWESDIAVNYRGSTGFGTLVYLAQENGYKLKTPPPKQDVKDAFGDANQDTGAQAVAQSYGPSISQRRAKTHAELIFPEIWQGQAIPKQEWLVDEWIPTKSITAIYAPGGAGKSKIIQQLATARALGDDWLGLPCKQGKTLFVSCEDDRNQLHMRQSDINSHYMTDYRSLGKMIGFKDMVSAKIVADLVYFRHPDNEMVLSDFCYELTRDAVSMGADMIVLDTLAHVFPGNENARDEVSEFVKKCLQRINEVTGAAIVLIGHMSKAAAIDPNLAASDMAYSGSTAWHGSARSQLILRYATEDEAMAGSGIRVLANGKNNNSTDSRSDPKKTILLEWSRGVFVPLVPPQGAAGGNLNDITETYVMHVVDEAEKAGVSLQQSARAKIFIGTWAEQNVPKPDGCEKIIGPAAVGAALKRLLMKGDLEVSNRKGGAGVIDRPAPVGAQG